MGTGIELKCPKCNKEYIFYMGIGFAFCDKMLMDLNKEDNLLYMYRDGVDIDKLKDMMKNGVLKEGYGKQIFQCPKCREYANKIYFEVENGNEVFKSKYICKKCNIELRKARKPYKCSKCDINLKMVDDLILWD